MTAIERLLATAKAELGYLEKKTNAHLDQKTVNAGNNDWTKFARDLDALGVYNGKKNGYAWCDMFCDWCFIRTFGLDTALKMTGQPMAGHGAGCTSSAGYYKAIGRFFRNTPQPGDQIFFSKDGGKTFYHTGLVEKVAGGRVYTIEGNTSSAPGVVENGGCVRDKSYSLSYTKIGGYGRPDYSIVPEEEDDMDQQKFNEMFRTAIADYRKDLRDNDSSTYSEAARRWAVDTGLIVGNGTTVEGLPNFMWEDLTTREQLITVLYRFALEKGLA